MSLDAPLLLALVGDATLVLIAWAAARQLRRARATKAMRER